MKVQYNTETNIVHQNNSSAVEEGHIEYTSQSNYDARLNLDMMASTHQSINRDTREDIMEDLGKRRIIRELEEFEEDLIEEFLKSREI
jgi:hypothetical protein